MWHSKQMIPDGHEFWFVCRPYYKMTLCQIWLIGGLDNYRANAAGAWIDMLLKKQQQQPEKKSWQNSTFLPVTR